MPIDMMTLEAALQPIEEVGKGEMTFPVGQTEVTLRLLLPDEEIASQKFAIQAFDEGSSDDKYTVLAYMDRMRLSVLSYALIRVGDSYFGDSETVAVPGETLPNGKPVTIERHVALRKLLGRWSRPIITSMFAKYVELVGDVEERSNKAIQFEPSDIDAEIERLEAQIQELRKKKKKQKELSFSDELRAIDTHRDKLKEEPRPSPPTPEEEDEPEDEVIAEEVVAEEEPQRPSSRRSIIPENVPPPDEVPQGKQPEVPGTPVPPHTYDTFVDTGDQEAFDQQIALENQRLIAMRRQQSSQVPPRGMRREAPHEAAAQVQEELSEEEQAIFRAQAKKAGQVHGVDAYSLGASEELVKHSRKGRVNPQEVALNKGPDPRQSRNPRFNPSR